MRLHQVLTGSCNNNLRTFAKGQIEDTVFVAYASGCDLVILDSRFRRVQIIPDVTTKDHVQISGVDCSLEGGCVAVSYADRICLFEPIRQAKSRTHTTTVHFDLDPIISSDCLAAAAVEEGSAKAATVCPCPFKWVRSAALTTDTPLVNDIAWSPTGERLLSAGATLQVWQRQTQSFFQVGDDTNESPSSWACVWRRTMATPVTRVSFSPDGLFFASLGLGDCTLRVWYEVQGRQKGRDVVSPSQQLALDYVLLAHPVEITTFQWRHTSRYMPLGAVANVILTSCADNVCRIWVETFLPADGLLSDSNMQHANSSVDECLQLDLPRSLGRTLSHAFSNDHSKDTSSASVHDFHSLSLAQDCGASPMLHFSLAAAINPENDIPLLPTASASIGIQKPCNSSSSFVMHFLNNKQLHFNLQAERALSHHAGYKDSELFDATQVAHFLREWHSTADMLFAVHPIDGSFLVWMVEWLDETSSGSQRQAQVSFSSSIPAAFPLADATSICPYLVIYGQYGEAFSPHTASRLAHDLFEHTRSEPVNPWKSNRSNDGFVLPCARILSKHHNGSLNLWQVNFLETSNFQTVVSVAHLDRMSGHRFLTDTVVCHPLLPLLLTTSHYTSSGATATSSSADYTSELIMWRVDPVGPLHCGGGGLTELARVNSTVATAFNQVAWLTLLLPASALGFQSQNQTALFVANKARELRLYAAVVDARAVLARFQRADHTTACESVYRAADSLESSFSQNESDTELFVSSTAAADAAGNDLVSLQSSAQPGCILELPVVKDSFIEQNAEVLLLHVFAESLVTGRHRSSAEHNDSEYFYLILMQNKRDAVFLSTWKLVIVKKYGGSSDVSTSLRVESDLLACQTLPLPSGVLVVCATVCASHLSSASIYPACFAPYLITTACSDARLRFWKPCSTTASFDGLWAEWTMLLSNSSMVAVEKDSQPICVSCAYSGRVAVAFCATHGYKVSIFEHESSGGCEWLLEDNISLEFTNHLAPSCDNNTAPVQLAWVSTEDGSHLLSISVATEIQIFAPVSSKIAGLCLSEWRASHPAEPLDLEQKEFRWMKLRALMLATADGLLPRPMHTSWVREGLLIVGMAYELHVYSQWKDDATTSSEPPRSDGSARQLTELALAKSSANVNYTRLKTTYSAYQLNRSQQSYSTRLCDYSKDHGHKPTTTTTATTPNARKDSSVAMSMSELAFLQDVGIFEAAQICNPTLPQYHPNQLMELLRFGKIRRVKAILAHLTRCIESSTDLQGLRECKRRQTVSNCEDNFIFSVDGLKSGFTNENVSEAEIRAIPPLPIYALLSSDNAVNVQCDGALDEQTGEVTENDDLQLEGSEEEDDACEKDAAAYRRQSLSLTRRRSPFYFGPTQANVLAFFLAQIQLPGLSRLEQMYLVALASVIAKTQSDETQSVAPSSQQLNEFHGVTESLDDCGVRFFLIVQYHNYLLNTLPHHQRTELVARGLANGQLVWAFHSEAERELCAKLPCAERGALSWFELRQYGAAWWIKNDAYLRQCIETVARLQFQARQDPMDAALFFVALRKVKILLTLFKRVEPHGKMASFLEHFSTPDEASSERWVRAAKNNAYQLLSKQRFEHAAAFFLLARDLRGAIEVCVNSLHDLQLALVLARLYGVGASGAEAAVNPALKNILCSHVLGQADAQSPVGFVPLRSADPFLRSMAFWMLKEYENALNTLLEQNRISSEQSIDLSIGNPSVFNFYIFLRNHPLILRQRRLRNDLIKHVPVTFAAAGDAYQKKLLLGALEAAACASREKLLESITPVERRLFFKTAHAYFRAGCPMLALEVLCKIPDYLELDDENNIVSADTFTWQEDGYRLAEENVDADEDRGFAEDVFALDFVPPMEDDSAPSFTLSDDSSSSEEEEHLETIKPSVLSEKNLLFESMKCSSSSRRTLDVMTHQLRFIACLKIMTEELSTLATGFEVDGGQLRFQLYNWLEREVNVLQSMCHYGDDMCPEAAEELPRSAQPTQTPRRHDTLLADNQDFKAKLERIARRRCWLRQHHQLLRTLLSFSSLLGGSGGGLTSVRVELTLLLQELQQDLSSSGFRVEERVSVTDNLPLISASIAGVKTVVADPVRILHALKRDVLGNLASYSKPPDKASRELFLLRNLSTALSACVYQSLCDSNCLTVAESAFTTSHGFDEGATGMLFSDGFLMSGVRRLHSSSVLAEVVGSHNENGASHSQVQPSSDPKKWPGVEALRAVLTRGDCMDSAMPPSLHVLLVECLLAVYLGALAYGLATADAGLLYRLCAHPFNAQLYSSVFGGGLREQVEEESTDTTFADCGAIPRAPLGDRLAESRINLYIHSMHGRGQKPVWERSRTTRERFIPPRISILNYFLAKPSLEIQTDALRYDSDDDANEDEDDVEEDEEYESDDEDFTSERKVPLRNKEHSNKESYSWHLVRTAVVRLVLHRIACFLPEVGLDLGDLAASAPQLYCTLRRVSAWEDAYTSALKIRFDGGKPPLGYLGAFRPETMENEPPRLLKYKAMLDPLNVPFSDVVAARALRRLWQFLIGRKALHHLFFRYLFPVELLHVPSETAAVKVNAVSVSCPKEERQNGIVHHMENVVVVDFCFNQANLNCMSLTSAKDLLELDIGDLLAVGLRTSHDVDLELDLKSIRGQETLGDFLVLSTTDDANCRSSRSNDEPIFAPSAPGVVPIPRNLYLTTSSLSNPKGFVRPIGQRSFSGDMRCLASHPSLPYYLAGNGQGVVELLEWGHRPSIVSLSLPSPSRINAIRFNAQGNRFGVVDHNGTLSMWQTNLLGKEQRPYSKYHCREHSANDLSWLGCSSLVATCGTATSGSAAGVVLLWDTLLPQSKAAVRRFVHPSFDHGVKCMTLALRHQTLLVGGARGDLSLLDLRQGKVRHTFAAHDAAINCLTLDLAEQLIVTGSADRSIKLWLFDAPNELVMNLPHEHSAARGGLFRSPSNNEATGVRQVMIRPAEPFQSHRQLLFSCGADGSVKWRMLPSCSVLSAGNS